MKGKFKRNFSACLIIFRFSQDASFSLALSSISAESNFVLKVVVKHIFFLRSFVLNGIFFSSQKAHFEQKEKKAFAALFLLESETIA